MQSGVDAIRHVALARSAPSTSGTPSLRDQLHAQQQPTRESLVVKAAAVHNTYKETRSRHCKKCIGALPARSINRRHMQAWVDYCGDFLCHDNVLLAYEWSELLYH